jgi:hypothetical protein
VIFVGRPELKLAASILFDPTEETVEFAGRILHKRMESLYPGPQDDWIDLSDQERDFYRLSVKAVLKAVADVYAAALPEIEP